MILHSKGTKTEFEDIAKNYMSSWYFYVDVIAALPLEFFCFAESGRNERFRLFAFLKLNRVLKVVEVSPHALVASSRSLRSVLML